MLDPAQQLEIIRRGTAEMLPEAEFVRRLEEGKPLRIKYGIDPTGPDVHLGHAVPIRKLRAFQELGPGELDHYLATTGAYPMTNPMLDLLKPSESDSGPGRVQRPRSRGAVESRRTDGSGSRPTWPPRARSALGRPA